MFLPFNVKISVVAGDTYDKEVTPNMKISEIISYISSKINFPEKDIEVSFNSKILEPETTLKGNAISPNSVLCITIKSMSIYLKSVISSSVSASQLKIYAKVKDTDKEAFELVVTGTTKISEVSKQISSKINTGINKIILHFLGQTLEEDKAVKDYNIKECDLLVVTLKQEEAINVNPPQQTQEPQAVNEKTIIQNLKKKFEVSLKFTRGNINSIKYEKYEISGTMLISNIIKEIARREGINQKAFDIKLYYKTKLLNTNLTAAACNLNSSSMINVHFIKREAVSIPKSEIKHAPKNHKKISHPTTIKSNGALNSRMVSPLHIMTTKNTTSTSKDKHKATIPNSSSSSRLLYEAKNIVNDRHAIRNVPLTRLDDARLEHKKSHCVKYSLNTIDLNRFITTQKVESDANQNQSEIPTFNSESQNSTALFQRSNSSEQTQIPFFKQVRDQKIISSANSNKNVIPEKMNTLHKSSNVKKFMPRNNSCNPLENISTDENISNYSECATVHFNPSFSKSFFTQALDKPKIAANQPRAERTKLNDISSIPSQNVLEIESLDDIFTTDFDNNSYMPNSKPRVCYSSLVTTEGRYETNDNEEAKILHTEPSPFGIGNLNGNLLRQPSPKPQSTKLEPKLLQPSEIDPISEASIEASIIIETENNSKNPSKASKPSDPINIIKQPKISVQPTSKKASNKPAQRADIPKPKPAVPATDIKKLIDNIDPYVSDDRSRFTLSEEQEMYVCSHCNRVPHFSTAYECLKCGKILDKICFIKVSHAKPICPGCKKNSLVPLAMNTKKTMSKFLIACPNRGSKENDGCQQVVQWGNLEAHVKACGFSVVKCNFGCQQKVFRKDYENHKLNTCPMLKNKCQFCNLKFTEIGFKGHEKTCIKNPNARILCKYSNVGCKVVLTRIDMEVHIKENKEKHMELMEKMLQEKAGIKF